MEKRENLIYYNSAMYVSRANEALNLVTDDESSKVIVKTHTAQFDGIPYKNATSNIKIKWNGQWWPKYQTPSKREKHIFTTGGITFGLEICLEHDPEHRIVKNVMIDRYPKQIVIEKDSKKVVIEEYPKINIQLHLLIAGGMPVEPQSVAAIPGGYILRTDGYCDGSPSTSCQKIEMYVDVVDPEKTTSQADPNSDANLSGDMPVEATLDIGDKHYLYIPNPTDGDEVYWGRKSQKQQITIYRRQTLP